MLYFVLLLLLLLVPSCTFGQAKATLAQEDVGVCNPLRFSATRTSATLTTAINSVGSALLPDCRNSKILLIPPGGTWTIIADLNIPARITVRIPAGASITINGGVTLTLNALPDCDKPQECIVSAGTGVLAFGASIPTTGISSFVSSGCLPAVPAPASLTFDAFTCNGIVVVSGVWIVPVEQAAATVGPLNLGDGTYWLALHRDTTTVVASWTREAGTHYLWRLSSSQPSDPTGGMVFTRVTVSGGAITTVALGITPPRPVPLSAISAVYNVLHFGATGNCSTNDYQSVQRLLDWIPAGSTIYFPQTSAACYEFNISRLIVNKEIHVACDSWKTSLHWNMHNSVDPGCPSGGCSYGGFNVRHDTAGQYLASFSMEGCHLDFGSDENFIPAYASWRRGLDIMRTNNISLTRNWFQGAPSELVGLGNGFDAVGTEGKKSWITNNLFTNWRQDGLNVNTDGNTVIGNRFENGVIAVEFGGSGSIFKGNEGFNLKEAFFAIQANNFVLDSNICRTCYTNGAAVTGAGPILINFRGNNTPASNGIVSNNVLINTGGYANVTGIVVFASDTSTPRDNVRLSFVNNNISGFSNGIYIPSCSECTVTGNQIANIADTAIVLAGVPPYTVQKTNVSGNTLAATNALIADYSTEANGNAIGWNSWSKNNATATQVFGVGLRTATDGDTSPDIKRSLSWNLSNTGATSITAFDGGTLGDQRCFHTTNGNTTLVHNAGGAGAIFLQKGSNWVVPSSKNVCFSFDGVTWFEIGNLSSF